MTKVKGYFYVVPTLLSWLYSVYINIHADCSFLAIRVGGDSHLATYTHL